MLRKHVLVVILLSLVGACAPQTGSSVPTPAGTGSVPGAASGAVSGATGGPAVAKPQRGGTLTFGMSREAGELDPHKGSIGATRIWTRFLYNTLTNTDVSGDIIPELAESWSYPDPNTLVMKLKKGVKFHDGTDFNAQAVKFNLERIMDPATKSRKRSALDNVGSIEVVDDHTVKLSLRAPEAFLDAVLADTYVGGIISPASVKKWGDETLTHPVGTGPFEFVEWVKGDHMTVKRFDGYWRKDEYGDQLPYLDQVIIKPIPDRSVLLTNLRTGAVDLIDSVLPSDLPTLKADSSLKSVEWSTSRIKMGFNCTKPPFNDNKVKALRQAIAWAIDRQAIHEAIYAGTGEIGRYALSERSWAFDPTGKFYTRDLAKAKEKLAEAGKPNGFKFAAKVYNTDLELRVAQAIKGQLAEAGIDMEIVALQERQAVAERTAGDFQAFTGPASSLPADLDDDLYRYLHSKGQYDYGKCSSNPQVDEALEKARQVSDKAERKALYAKAQALVLEDSLYIFIHQDNLTSAMNQKVMGFRPNSAIYYLQHDWIWLKK